jgi:hypothetical protein
LTEVRYPPNVHPVGPGRRLATGQDLLEDITQLDGLLQRRGLPLPVTVEQLDRLRLLVLRLEAAERVAAATGRQAAQHSARSPGLLHANQAPAPTSLQNALQDRGDVTLEAGAAVGADAAGGDDPAGGADEWWDPRPSRRRAAALLLVGLGLALVFAGFGLALWFVLVWPLAALLGAARLLRLPGDTADEPAHDEPAHYEPEDIATGDSAGEPAHYEIVHDAQAPDEAVDGCLPVPAAQSPAVRATVHLVELAKARFAQEWAAAGQAPRAGRVPREAVADLVVRATAPVVLGEGAAAYAAEVAAALPAAPVMVLDPGARPDGVTAGSEAPGVS